MADGVKGVGKNNSSVSKSDLEDRTVLLCQSSCDFGVAASEFQQASEDRISGDFWDTFDFRGVCSVEVSNEKIEERNEDEARYLETHDCCVCLLTLTIRDGGRGLK